jgi:uncharacterized delta-60 repeat protein
VHFNKVPMLILAFVLGLSPLYAQRTGTLDTSFNTTDTGFNSGKGVDCGVTKSIVQSDGKIIIVGCFREYNGVPRKRIARVNIDGSLDISFDPGTSIEMGDQIHSLLLKPNGKIIIAGEFNKYNGIASNNIAQLNTDGSLDMSFDPGTGANGGITSAAMQSDGSIIIVGWFTEYNSERVSNVARLLEDGTLDRSFNSGTGAPGGYGLRIAVQESNNKIIVAGTFNSFNGTSRRNMVRLNADGTLDTGFNPPVIDNVFDLVAQPDGKVVYVGSTIGRLNANGARDTSFDASNIMVEHMAVVRLLPDGKLMVGAAGFPHESGRRLARLNANGSLDTSFGLSEEWRSLVQTIAIQPGGKIFMGGVSSSVYNMVQLHMARFNDDGSIDTDFNAQTGANGPVYQTLVQPDGKILVAGSFSKYNSVNCNNIIRLNADGSIDTDFNTGRGVDNTVTRMALQSDGKVIIGGTFNVFDGRRRIRIARLNSNGSLDTSYITGAGVDDDIAAIAVQADGKVVIAGSFENYNGTKMNGIARTNPDGSLDTNFDTGSEVRNYIRSLALLPNGQLYIAGGLNGINGTDVTEIARLNSNGSLDETFNLKPNATNFGLNGRVNTLSLQNDNKLIVTGDGSLHLNGNTLNRIARFNTDGTYDTNFDPGHGVDNDVNRVVVLPNGKMIIAGEFTSYNGINRKGLALINANGSLDESFDPLAGPDGPVSTVAVQSDGNLLIGGNFTSYNGIGRNRIARVLMGNIVTAAPAAKNKMNVRLYPNPSTGYVSIDLTGAENAGPVEVKVFNLMGQVVMSKSFDGSAKKLSLDTLTNGTYVVRVSTAKHVYTQQLVLKR